MQVAEGLKRRMAEQALRLGDRFLSVREVSEEFKVSMVTAHKALQILCRQGWLTSEKGRGSFVKQIPVPSGNLKPIAVWSGNPDESLQGDTYRGHILLGMQQELAQHNLALRFIQATIKENDWSELEAVIRDMSGEIGGVITFPTFGKKLFLDFLDSLKLSWIAINQVDHLARFNFVASDYYQGALEAGELMAKGGARNFWIYEHNIQMYQATLRLRGFHDGLIRQALVQPEVRIEKLADFRDAVAYEHTQKLLKTAGHPDAIFCAGDHLAIGAMKACQDAGLNVPQDVSIIGFTGLELCRYTTPSLTVAALPMEEIGRQAALRLLAVQQEASRRVDGLILPTTLIVRESTRPITPDQVRNQKLNQEAYLQ